MSTILVISAIVTAAAEARARQSNVVAWPLRLTTARPISENMRALMAVATDQDDSRLSSFRPAQVFIAFGHPHELLRCGFIPRHLRSQINDLGSSSRAFRSPVHLRPRARDRRAAAQVVPRDKMQTGGGATSRARNASSFSRLRLHSFPTRGPSVAAGPSSAACAICSGSGRAASRFARAGSPVVLKRFGTRSVTQTIAQTASLAPSRAASSTCFVRYRRSDRSAGA